MNSGKIIEQKEVDGHRVIVRYIEATDVVQLRDYINQLSREKTFITLQGEQISLEEEKKYIEDSLKKISNKSVVKLVLEVDGKIVGTADVTLGQRTHTHVGYMGLSIDVSVRGKKLGRLLFESLMTEAKKQLPGLRVFQLSVFENNIPARKLYESCGFTVAGTLPNTINHMGGYVHELLMVKQLVG